MVMHDNNVIWKYQDDLLLYGFAQEGKWLLKLIDKPFSDHEILKSYELSRYPKDFCRTVEHRFDY